MLGILVLSFSHAQVRDVEPVDQNLEPEFTDIDANSFRLKNGLLVKIVRNRSMGEVKLQLDINNPPHSDFELAGIDEVTNAILGTVSKDLTSAEINQQLNTLRATMDINLSSSTMTLPLSKLQEGLVLFAEVTTDAIFPQVRIEAEKEALIASIEKIRRDAEEIADNVAIRLAYGYEHPYGERPRIPTVRAINVNNIFLHYQANYTVDDAVLTIEGNITRDEVKPFLDYTFAPWTPSKPLFETTVETENVQYAQLNIVDVRGLDKSEVRIVNTTLLNESTADFYAAKIAVLALDRYLSTLPFSAKANLTIEDEVSLFNISAEIPTTETATGIMDVLSAAQRIRTIPITTEELTQAKNLILQDYDSEFLIEEREAVLERLDSITPDDVRLAAVEHIKYNQFRIIAVCDARAIYDTFKFIKIRNKKVPERFYNRAGDRLEAAPEFDRPLPENASAKTVFNKYINAIGGLALTTEIKSLYVNMRANVNESRLQLELRKTTAGNYMSALSIEGNLMSKLAKKGDSGYVLKNNQRVTLDSIQLEDARFKGLPFLELYPEEAKLVRIEAIDEQDFLIVDFNGISEEYYDVETGLKTMSIIKRKDVDIPIENRYSDYKRVEGILYPTKIIQKIGDSEIVFEVDEIVINPRFEPKDFE